MVTRTGGEAVCAAAIPQPPQPQNAMQADKAPAIGASERGFRAGEVRQEGDMSGDPLGVAFGLSGEPGRGNAAPLHEEEEQGRDQ
jgi:hypothetical protein